MKMTGYIVIDVGGLGYKVFMSESGIEKLGNIGENVKVHTEGKNVVRVIVVKNKIVNIVVTYFSKDYECQ